MPLPRSLSNLKGEVSEEKWVEARRWARGRASRRKYKMPESHKPDGKRLASGYYQLKTGRCRTGQYLHWLRFAPPPSAGGSSAPRKRETTSSRCVRNGGCSRRFCGPRCGRRPGGGRSGGRSGTSWRMRGAVGRYFPHGHDVGRLPPQEESDAGSEVSEWDLRELREREEEREADAEALGAEGELDGGAEPPLFLPAPLFTGSAEGR